MPTRVLIVDDEADIREIVGDYLSAAGYDVQAAADGREALGLLCGAPFDVAIVDWMLPDLLGSELSAHIEQAWPSCGVVLTTGHGADVIAEASGRIILRKPFTLRSLALRVEEVTFRGAR